MFHRTTCTVGRKTPLLSASLRSCYFAHPELTVMPTELSLHSVPLHEVCYCISLHKGCHTAQFVCLFVDEINRMQRSQGSGRDTALNTQSAVTSMSTNEAASSDGKSAAGSAAITIAALRSGLYA